MLLTVVAVVIAMRDDPGQISDWDWSRTHTWMEFNIRGKQMTPYQAQFAANHYDIIGIGGTFDGGPHSGEVTQAAAAKQLKNYNEKIKVVVYRHSRDCYRG